MTHLVDLDDEWGLWRLAAVRGAGMPVDWLDAFADDPAAAPAGMLARPAFVAALTWQNPATVRAWAGAAEAKLNGYRNAVLARYAQRYCAKNDSIGFFGPVGWAELVDDAGDEVKVTGDGGVRWGDVFFERWAIAALAAVWERDERLLPYLPVRLHPAVDVAGDVVRRPFRAPLSLSPDDRTVLDRVDGVRPLREVAADGDPARVLRLRDDGVLLVGFPVPAEERPERRLAGYLDAIDDAALREELRVVLDRLVRAREAVAGVARRPAELAAALEALDAEFSAATGGPAVREKSTTDSGRTVVYPDCRRDLDVAVPDGLVDRLRVPLGLLLRSARWLTEQTAEAAEQALTDTYRVLSRRGPEVTLSDLHFAAAGLLTGGPDSPIHEVAADFRLRWQEILTDATAASTATATAAAASTAGATAGARRAGDEIRLAGRDLGPQVEALFPAHAPGWAAARQHSPDLLLARTSDGPRWVLGELHVALNTLESRFFHTLADDRGWLLEATAADLADGRVVPGYPTGPQVDSRRYPPLAAQLPGRYLYWSYADDPGAPDGARSWPATGLVVRVEGGRLVAGPRGGTWAAPVVEFFGEFLSALVVNRFTLPGPGPRLVVDDLVVRRHGWRFTGADLPAGTVGRAGYRSDVLAGHLADLGLPRYLFAKTPLEPKPFYVDLRAPLMVNNLARAWRKLAPGDPVDLHEMLPGPDDLWCVDRHGQRYTTEFRLVAVDRRTSGRLPSGSG